MLHECLMPPYLCRARLLPPTQKTPHKKQVVPPLPPPVDPSRCLAMEVFRLMLAVVAVVLGTAVTWVRWQQLWESGTITTCWA